MPLKNKIINFMAALKLVFRDQQIYQNSSSGDTEYLYKIQQISIQQLLDQEVEQVASGKRFDPKLPHSQVSQNC